MVGGKRKWTERRVVCSTPFGITEVGIDLSLRRIPAGRAVLNAFRHHRGRHADASRQCRRRDACAQRLSASQRWALDVSRAAPASTRCAQRLSASQRSAHCTDPSRHTCDRDCAQRLSASQRWAHCQTIAASVAASMCSTPFGITEVGTSCDRDSCATSDRVLNAFRHH